MRKFLLLTFLFFFSVSAFAQIRIEKRRYNKGWYVSLNHKKNSSDEKPEITPAENPFASFQQQDSVLHTDENFSSQKLTNEPEIVSVLQTNSSDTVLQEDHFVSVKSKQIKTENILSEELKNPVPVKISTENNLVKTIPFSHVHPAEKGYQKSAPDVDWDDFVESLIKGLIIGLLIVGAIIGLILLGLGALIALYPAAAIGVLVMLGLASVFWKG